LIPRARYSFVVQVHPDGVSTVENIATRERVKIAGLEEVGPRIERWLEELQSEADQHDENALR
jgi:hypothetical protein